jgi:protein tyrosine phosphatase (PTP) superfamily phosphohydrolase (DUF442 family)
MIPQSLNKITNYLKIFPKLGTGGQPMPEHFAALHDAGYEVIINLALPDSTNALPNESELVAAQKMTYIHIPVIWESPTHQDLEYFFAAMETYKSQKVFVHCAMNMRVSAFVFLYRVLELDVPVEQAQTVLHHIWQPNPTWQQFIDTTLKELEK